MSLLSVNKTWNLHCHKSVVQLQCTLSFVLRSCDSDDHDDYHDDNDGNNNNNNNNNINHGGQFVFIVHIPTFWNMYHGK